MSEPNASSERNAEEQRRAATGYLVWPLALADMLREGAEETIWSRLHARQAFVFGALCSLGYLGLLGLPLVAIVSVPALSTGATIGVYTAGFSVDLAIGGALLALAVRYAIRAAHGELFSIPLVTAIVDRCFRVRRS